MAVERYVYKGSMQECEIKYLILEILDCNIKLDGKSEFILQKEYQKLLTDDEILSVSMKCESDNIFFNKFHTGYISKEKIFPLIIPRLNVHINIKPITLTIIALILDSRGMLNGFASASLALLGFNNRAFVKISEYEGEMCVLIEICHSNNCRAQLDVLCNIYQKECINNHLNCKYRSGTVCNIDKDKVKLICDNFVSNNILKLKNDYYIYNY